MDLQSHYMLTMSEQIMVCHHIDIDHVQLLPFYSSFKIKWFCVNVISLLIVRAYQVKQRIWILKSCRQKITNTHRFGPHMVNYMWTISCKVDAQDIPKYKIEKKVDVLKQIIREEEPLIGWASQECRKHINFNGPRQTPF